MLIVLSILGLLTLVTSVLALSSTGHLHTRIAALQEQQAATLTECQFQARVTRKVLIEKVLPCVGYKEPEPLEEQMEKAMAAFSSQLAKRGS